mgnify:CR=1 FL=1
MILRRSNNFSDKFDFSDDDFEESEVKVSYMDEYEYEEVDDTEEPKGNDSVFFNPNAIIDSLDGDGEIQTDTPKKKRRKRKATEEDSKKTKAKSTTMKKKKKLDVVYEIGDEVVYRRKKAKVMFGPYERNYKMFYELLFVDEGVMVTAVAQSVRKE